MNLRVFMIAFALVALGAGGKLAYDLAPEGSPLAEDQEYPSFTNCSPCAAHKADLENMRREKEARSQLDAYDDPDAE